MFLNFCANFFPYVSVILIGLVLYVTRNFNYWKKRDVPYLKPIPFFGTSRKLLTFRTTIGEFMGDIYFKTTKPYVGFFIGDRPYLLVRDPNLIKRILIKDFEYFVDRTMENNYKGDPLGCNILLLMKNPIWKSVRPKLTPLFTSGKMKQMFKLVMEVSVDLNAHINGILGKEIDAKRLCQRFTVDVISSCAFGIRSFSLECENAEVHAFAKRVFHFDWNRGIQITCCYIMQTIFLLFNMTFLDRSAANFFEKLFKESIENRRKTKIVRNDLVDIIIQVMEADKEIEFNWLLSQAIGFFIAGFETNSTIISFALFELCHNQEVQDRLRTEVLEMTEGGKNWSYDAIFKIDYLSYTIKETLRKYPSLPFLDRKCTKNYKIPYSDVVIEKGMNVYIPLLGLHFDPDYFPEPDKFIPERWAPGNKTWHDFSYLPFGTGPRNCIGERFGNMVTHIGLAYIISKFKVESSTNTPKKIHFNPKGFLLVSETGLPMKFSPIE